MADHVHLLPASLPLSASRARLVATCLLVLASAFAARPGCHAADQTNVVFILVDDLGYMDIGANNPNTFYETPNIDRLAATGVRFTDGYAANPVCSPTRYSIMSGKHPSRVDATNFFCGKRAGLFNPAPLRCEMPLDEVTLADAMKAGGYSTFFAGKWHLGPTPEYWPENRGFDFNLGGHVAGGPFKAGKYFSPYANPRLEDGPKGEHLPDRLAAETVKFIETRQGKPFFAYLSFYSVHTPLMAPEALVQKYRDKAERLGLTNMEAFGAEEQIWPDVDPSKQKGKVKNRRPVERPRKVRNLQSHATYAAMMESMDRNVGRVLDTLDSLQLADNTAVFFMSDNGGLSTSEGSPTSNLPLRGGKGWLYEGGIREPFLIRWPQAMSSDANAIQAGSTCDVPVVSMDFYPTILDITGLAAKPDQHLDGQSLAPLLRGGDAPNRDSLYWHYPHYSNQGGFPGAAIRQGPWKLIERFEDGQIQLYNLASDIGEKTDLSSKEPERVGAMRKNLHDWYEQVDAKFLEPKPDGPSAWRPE